MLEEHKHLSPLSTSSPLKRQHTACKVKCKLNQVSKTKGRTIYRIEHTNKYLDNSNSLTMFSVIFIRWLVLFTYKELHRLGLLPFPQISDGKLSCT